MEWQKEKKNILRVHNTTNNKWWLDYDGDFFLFGEGAERRLQKEKNECERLSMLVSSVRRQSADPF